MQNQHHIGQPAGPTAGTAPDPSAEDESFKPWSLQRRWESTAGNSVLAAAQDPPVLAKQTLAVKPGRHLPRRRPGSLLLLLVAAWLVGGASLVYGPFAWELAAAVQKHPEVKPALWVVGAVLAAMFVTLWVIIYRGSRRELGLVRTQLEERQQAETRLAASLREKEALLKEVHHRVKNNMQLITSLVNLQSGSIPEGPMRQVFGDFHGRVRTIALISERLYQSKNLAIIDMPGFVTTLGEDLLSAHDAVGRVRLDTNVEAISLDVDTAVPCGLIINELVANSLRHGFAGGRQGVLGISLHPNGNNTLNLNVCDDGAGIPPGVDFETSDSLGLQLVRILTSQLDGSVQLDKTPGTSFTVVFPQPDFT